MNNELTVNDYLDNLEQDRQGLITALRSKGVTVDDNATFTELVPKINGLVDINGYYDLTKKSSGGITKYIKQIPMIDTSGYTNMSYMFSSYNLLITIPQLDTSNVTNMDYMFYNCSSLTTIPQLNTSNVTDMRYMFSGCSKLTSIPQLDTSKVTSMEQMFYVCSSLIEIPLLNTSNVTRMSYMFYNCSSLTTIPLLDTGKVTSMESMFGYCRKITTIPQLDTSKVTNMSWMFYNCTALETIPQLDTSNVTNISDIVTSCRTLTTLGGFTNLGQVYSTTQNANYNNYTLDLSYSNNLTHDSLMNVINNLYDIAAKGCQPQQLKLGSTNIAKLTDEEIAIATNKGWNVVA